MRKNKSFAQSVKYAAKGILKSFRRERNFWIYTLIVTVTTLINLLLQIPVSRFFIIFICAIGAFSAECLNSAIERLCDKIEKDFCETIGYIKDVAAGSVLWWGIAYFGTEIFLILEKLNG